MIVIGLDVPPPLKRGRGDCGARISTTGTASAPTTTVTTNKGNEERYPSAS